MHKIGELKLPDFLILIIKQQLSRQWGIGVKMDIQVNGTAQSPEIALHIYGEMIFNKDAKAFHGEKDNVFHKGNNWIAKKKATSRSAYTITKFNLK